MIHSILARPWIALAFVLILVFLWLVAWKRSQHDRMKKRRTQTEQSAGMEMGENQTGSDRE
jgi:membrane protein implicated in regulation of membrane protease activity